MSDSDGIRADQLIKSTRYDQVINGKRQPMGEFLGLSYEAGGVYALWNQDGDMLKVSTSMLKKSYYPSPTYYINKQSITDNITRVREESLTNKYDKLDELKTWIGVCGVIHLICFIVSMILYLFVKSFSDYDIQTTLVKSFNEEYDIVKVIKFNITLASSLFSLLSCVFHFVSLAFWDDYVDMIYGDEKDCGVNVYRWIEYSLSASLMNVIIAAICKIGDFSVLLLIFGSTALTMTFGIPLELLRHSKYYGLILFMSWLFYTVCNSTFFITIFMYSPLSQIPIIAWVVLLSLTFLFNLFGIWQITLTSIGKKFSLVDYEIGYCALSAIAKTLLFGLVIWGGATDSSWLDRPLTCKTDAISNMTI